MRFANFYQQFIQSFSRITESQSSILQITNRFTIGQLRSIREGSIKEVGDSSIGDKAGIVDKANIEASEFGMGFLTPEATLTFAKLRYHFVAECYIYIKINILGHAISRVSSQLSLDGLS